ncbi:MAG: hypothetical protein SNF33_05315 [Candidatus Algichlamydia australiensis]|nr:hypothetical protein [Chlamydiales bacterium]
MYLGEYAFEKKSFPNLVDVFAEFKGPKFEKLNEHMRRCAVSRALCHLIEEQEEPCFLLPHVIDFISKLHEEKIIGYYTFSSFELWLNQYSSLSDEENYHVRAKIVGARVPRDAYQVYFPIGMGKRYEGSHFVTAHSSPDLDTTVASFWGWVDAFGARVGKGLHIWNVPGGPPGNQIEIGMLFYDLLGKGIFSNLAKGRSRLTLSSYDLMTQEGLIKKLPQEPALSLDHERNLNAIVLIDKEGYFLGDWRYFDVEGVRQVVTALENCLRWIENDMHSRIITFFAKKELKREEVPPFAESLMYEEIKSSEPGRDLTLRQQKLLQLYLEKVLRVASGFNCTFLELVDAMESASIADFSNFKRYLKELETKGFFDSSGALIEDRPKLFSHIEKIMSALSDGFREIRLYVEQLEIALKIKSNVFGYAPQYLGYRADIEEVKTKMGSYPYLTVTYPDPSGKKIPVGVVHASSLQKPTLGTVTLRDFSNREETKVPSFLEVISVIDHHKSNFSTQVPATIIVSDAQSANALVAQASFTIHDRYSSFGFDSKAVDAQINELQGKKDRESLRLLQRLLQRQGVSEEYYIAKDRQFMEYLHYLFAILDDTDLLTKLSYRDVYTVASLVNRMKSIIEGKEVELIHFDDIPQDQKFVKKAAKRLLQCHDLHSLYAKVYVARENAVDEEIEKAAKGEETGFYLDTKIQNNCVRVGQSKLFRKNLPCFSKHVEALQKRWYEESLAAFEKKDELDLHLHMISTIASAEELVSGNETRYEHKDELWIFIPKTDLGTEHLRLFLSAFQNSPQIAHAEVEGEFVGENAEELATIFKESFRNIPMKVAEKPQGPPIAILRYPAGTINSRKSMITPYLPTHHIAN